MSHVFKRSISNCSSASISCHNMGCTAEGRWRRFPWERRIGKQIWDWHQRVIHRHWDFLTTNKKLKWAIVFWWHWAVSTWVSTIDTYYTKLCFWRMQMKSSQAAIRAPVSSYSKRCMMLFSCSHVCGQECTWFWSLWWQSNAFSRSEGLFECLRLKQETFHAEGVALHVSHRRQFILM